MSMSIRETFCIQVSGTPEAGPKEANLYGQQMREAAKLLYSKKKIS